MSVRQFVLGTRRRRHCSDFLRVKISEIYQRNAKAFNVGENCPPSQLSNALDIMENMINLVGMHHR